MRLSSFLTEAKNTHLEHVEDSVLNQGVQGTRDAINFLQSLRDTLAGTAKSRANISMKWDGAPAVFAGQDPRDGKFFVAKKGIFAKTPKVYKTNADIDADTSGDLNKKLKLALEHFPKLGIKGIIQGDFLFERSDIKTQNIDGQSFVTFHPNTIVYAVPVSSELAKQILRSKVGVVWHTEYSGDSFENLKAKFNVDIASKLKPTNDVWFTDAVYRDLSGTATMTAAETEQVTKILSEIGKIFRATRPATFSGITDNDELLELVKTYNNTKIRAGQKIGNVSSHVNGLVNWITDKYHKKIDSMKTEKGKLTWQQKRKDVIKYFSNTPKSQIENLFRMMDLMVEAKSILLKKLNNIQSLRTFLSTKDGFKVTGQEGFVVADRFGKNAVKLVDRLEFSYANFSSEIKKGWEK